MASALTGNMVLFDAEGKIRRYDGVEGIMQDFYDLRMQFYERRKAALLQVRYDPLYFMFFITHVLC